MEAKHHDTQGSVAESEATKSHELEIRKQIEYYLSDNNLKQDEYFYKLIKDSEQGTVPLESFLNCNKIKKLNAKKEDILKAISDSEKVEISGDGVGIKRKNNTPLPEFEPKVGKKVKTDNQNQNQNNAPKENKEEERKGFEPKILKITLANADENLKWNQVQSEIEKEFAIKVNYTRLNGTEGHIAVNSNSLPEETIQKVGYILASGKVKIGDNEVKIEDCLGDDLKKFYNDHGKHLDMCIERAGLKKKQHKKANKDQREETIDFIFNNHRYTSLEPIKYMFKSILQKTDDGEQINEADHKLLLEILKYHDKYQEKVRDLKHFTVGQHPSYKQTRCFFVVRNDGTQEDFSLTKCIENLKNSSKPSEEKKE